MFNLRGLGRTIKHNFQLVEDIPADYNFVRLIIADYENTGKRNAIDSYVHKIKKDGTTLTLLAP